MAKAACRARTQKEWRIVRIYLRTHETGQLSVRFSFQLRFSAPEKNATRCFMPFE